MSSEKHFKVVLFLLIFCDIKMNSQLSRGMHTKKLKQIREKKHMEGQNGFMKTILQLKSLEKTEIFLISML